MLELVPEHERQDIMSRAISALSARLPALLVVLVGICCLAGCSDDVSRDHPGIIGAIGARTPDQAWQSIEQSLNAHSVDGWENAIATNFEYVPDPASAAEFPDAYTSWRRDVELAFAEALFAADIEIDADLVVNGAICPASSGGTVTWPNVEYSVVVAGHGDASPVTYRGFANLEFGLEGNFWYLTRWVDLQGAPAPWNENVICPTLGELRAVYRDR